MPATLRALLGSPSLELRLVTAEQSALGTEITWVHSSDLVDPTPFLSPGQVLLTNHVIEQLPRHVPAAVETLLRAQPLEVVHIEPCPELLRPWRSALDLATWMHTAASDYQRTLLGELARRHECGQITVLEVTPLGYGPMPRSLPTLIRWRPGQP